MSNHARAKRLAPVEGGQAVASTALRVGPSPMARAISTRLGRESPPAIEVPVRIAARWRSRTGAERDGRRLVGHAGEGLLVESEGLLVDGPGLRRSSRSRARVRAARARRCGSPRVRATSAAAKTVVPLPGVPGVAERRGQVEQQVTSQLEGRSVEQLKQADGAVEMTRRRLEGQLVGRLGRGPPGDVDCLRGVARQGPFAVVVGEGVERGVGAESRGGPRWLRRRSSACAPGGWWGSPRGARNARGRGQSGSGPPRLVPPAAPRAEVASSTASSSSSPEGPPAASTMASSNSAPITAAQRSASLATSDRADSRRPMTSRIPSGMPRSTSATSLVHRSSRCTISPDSARWSSIWATKNGLPSVSSCTALASSSAGTVQVVTGGALHELLDFLAVQTREVQTGHTALPAQVPEDISERMAAIEVGVAVGRQDEHPDGRDRPQDVTKKQQRWLVGPMEIVEHEHERGVVRAGREQVRHRLEQAVPLGLRLGRAVARPGRAPGP